MMEKEYMAPFPMITASTSANEKFASRGKETKTVESASSALVITPKCTKH